MLAIQRANDKNKKVELKQTVPLKDKKTGWFGFKKKDLNQKNQILVMNQSKYDDSSSVITKENHHMPLHIPQATNMDQYIEVQVFTQNKEDC